MAVDEFMYLSVGLWMFVILVVVMMVIILLFFYCRSFKSQPLNNDQNVVIIESKRTYKRCLRRYGGHDSLIIITRDLSS